MVTNFVKTGILTGLMFGVCSAANAIPTVQIGAYAEAGSGEGIYADYQPNLNGPTEEDTAVTGSNTILAAGAYSPNADALIGGQYCDDCKDWSDFGFHTDFNGSGAIILASVADGASLTDLTIDGSSAIYSSFTETYFPNEHDPVKDAIADFMYFDIGNFAMNVDAVTNMAEEDGSSSDGELKELMLGGADNYDWIHFDLMALVTDYRGNTEMLTTSLNFAPGSKDVTYKCTEDCVTVPEPSSLALLTLGLIGLLARRKIA